MGPLMNDPAADTPPKTRLSEVQSVSPKSYRADLTLDPAKKDRLRENLDQAPISVAVTALRRLLD